MCCPHCQGAEQLFDRRIAASDLKGYRRRGASRQTQLLITRLREVGVEGLTLLDIGGGVGAIQHALLAAGVVSAVHVDASSGYLWASEQEANRLDHADRVTYLHGDFVALAPGLEPVDVVTLDRVICCYPDMPALVRLSAERARRFYGLVFPLDTWWVRLGMRLLNLGLWLRRNPFRVWVHPGVDVDQVIRQAGLAPGFKTRMGFWQIWLYVRPG